MSKIFKTSKGSSQVWRVTKTYRNGKTIHHLLVTVDPGCEGDFETWANDAAYYWAEADTSGHNYGYEYKIEIETDADAINKAIENECKHLNQELSYLMERANNIVEIINNNHIKFDDVNSILEISKKITKK